MLKVYSHPRSGANYLAALLKRNFYINDNTSESVTWGHHSRPRESDKPVEWAKLLGGFGGPDTKHNGPSIYIYRDGRAVAYSIWKNKDFLSPGQLKNDWLSYFLESKLDWEFCPSVQKETEKNIAQHWEMHVRSWHKAYSNAGHDKVLFVRYEDAIKNVPNLLLKVSKAFSLKMPKNISYVKEMVGHSKERLNLDWQQWFSQSNYNYYHQFILRDNPYLYYSPSSIPQMAIHDECSSGIKKIKIF
tara:strand:- start:1085 stop:1819 length:735 start_codon:yes stop_codon:yes gene_type:complete